VGDTAGGDDAGLKIAHNITRSTKRSATFVPGPIFLFLTAGCANSTSRLPEGSGGGSEIGSGILRAGGRANGRTASRGCHSASPSRQQRSLREIAPEATIPRI
jgi:hypothetical protein